jgi:hypothetical protein
MRAAVETGKFFKVGTFAENLILPFCPQWPLSTPAKLRNDFVLRKKFYHHSDEAFDSEFDGDSPEAKTHIWTPYMAIIDSF